VKNLLLIIFIGLFSLGLKTDKKNLIGDGNIDVKYLEYKVKNKIDSIRISNKLKPLISDSILYLAAKHHSDYMLKNSILTHKEAKEKLRNSWNRVEYYKGSYLRVGENVLHTYYNEKVLFENRKYQAYTYKELVYLIVDLWVNSPGHLKNIKSKDFTHTALAISADEDEKEIYVCQVFAGDIGENYKAKTSKEFFPYE
jgi:uncharacterized protein YkwD